VGEALAPAVAVALGVALGLPAGQVSVRTLWLPSLTSTVLPQPLAKTTASAAKPIQIAICIHCDASSLDALDQKLCERDDERRKKSVCHTLILGAPPTP
jgi:hypothetical protein